MGAGHSDSNHSSGHHLHSPAYYVKVWGILLVLLVISLVGPMAEIRWLTIMTAFGIAFVKAMIVCAYFMHLNIEKKFVWYMLLTMILAMGMFWFGTVTDVNHVKGSRWIKESSTQEIEKHKDWHKALEGEH